MERGVLMFNLIGMGLAISIVLLLWFIQHNNTH